MAAKKKGKDKTPRCEDCGGTGLRRDEVTVTAICHCAAGARRNAASYSD